MITEDYVSFEIAKLLKEKGFDAPTNTFYNPKKIHLLKTDTCRINRNAGIHVSAPTLQMTMKWLREVHDIAIEMEWEHLWYAYIKPMTSNPSEQDYHQCESSKYEEACEAAIKYCLENLIGMAKEDKEPRLAKEDKELLFKDICSRLPYGVI